MKRKIFFLLLVSVFILALEGCKAATMTSEPSAPTITKSSPTRAAPSPIPTSTSLPSATPTPTPMASPTPVPPTATPTPSLSGLSADPQRVVFKNATGTTLVGYYYPSKYANAPMIVLAHWAVGDQRDWCRIAPWLQNRADESPAEMPGCKDAPAAFKFGDYTSWWDTSWFPPMPKGTSFAVFTFDFSGYGESEGTLESSEDALAAFQTAAGLEGVDASRMVGAGASIGADGAPDGCLLYNNQAGDGRCLGAFSWSPGSYLGMEYSTVVADLATLVPSVPSWCLAAEGDKHALETCRSAADTLDQIFIFPSQAHGMFLIAPDLRPSSPAVEENSLELLLDFLGEVLGEEE